MGRFQSCRVVVERALRRAFYDGVLELYEGHTGPDIVTAVTLEGTLTLTINKAETLLIRLNEVAQRAGETATDDHAHTSHSEKREREEAEQDLSRLKKCKQYFQEKEQDLSGSRMQNSLQDTGHDLRKYKQDSQELEQSRKRKPSEAENPDTKVVPKKERGIELEGQSCEGKGQNLVAASDDATDVLKELDLSRKTRVTKQPAMHTAKEKCDQVFVKKERSQYPEDFVYDLTASSNYNSQQNALTVQDDGESGIGENSSARKEQNGIIPKESLRNQPSFEPVVIKEEPNAESILIDDDDDYSNNTTSFDQPPASPSQSAWYKMPQDSKLHQCDLAKEVKDRIHSSDPMKVEAGDPWEIALLLERNDCPVCGEVLHTRQELGPHLHTHRRALGAGGCPLCRANTLTLDALLLHLSTVHSPRLLPSCPSLSSTFSPALSSALSPDAFLGQALVPALPFTHNPMSAIASLVSMAACQAGPSSSDAASAFLGGVGGGGGGVGGVSSLMDQLIGYRGLLPCPVCQLLCSSRHHLATHITAAHSKLGPTLNPASGSTQPGEEWGEGGGNPGDAVSDEQGETVQDAEAETSSSPSSTLTCFDCSLSFRSQGAYAQHCLLQHNATSTVSQGSCSVCRRAFHSWKALHAHYLAAHAITSFCQRCKMGFGSTAELRAHYDSLHGAESRGLAFVCDICSKGFYSQSQCSAHKRSHTSEKSFACQVCGSAFFKRGDLSKHFRTVHAPNRVFACRFCGKRGTRMDNMRSHVKSHGKHMTRDEILSFIEEVKS